jgi:hypothetical protein
MPRNVGDEPFLTATAAAIDRNVANGQAGGRRVVLGNCCLVAETLRFLAERSPHLI